MKPAFRKNCKLEHRDESKEKTLFRIIGYLAPTLAIPEKKTNHSQTVLSVKNKMFSIETLLGDIKDVVAKKEELEHKEKVIFIAFFRIFWPSKNLNHLSK